MNAHMKTSKRKNSNQQQIINQPIINLTNNTNSQKTASGSTITYTVE